MVGRVELSARIPNVDRLPYGIEINHAIRARAYVYFSTVNAGRTEITRYVNDCVLRYKGLIVARLTP